MARLKECAGDDADGIGEVNDPGVLLGVPPDRLGDLQDDGNGPQRLRKPSRPRCLLPDAQRRVRPRLVRLTCLLPADPELDEHHVGIRDTRYQIGGADNRPCMTGGGEHPPGHSAHEAQPLGVRIDQPYLLEREEAAKPREPVDELGGVGGSPANDGQFHGQPLIPVSVMPSTKVRWAKKKMMTTGAMTSIVIAMVMPQSVPCAPRNV